ncbi:phage head-tail joining protein [Neptunicoccus cionae]|uniref:Uncharacterized protein n=1 Tax=Neptunicoccus cionae TaxID=2035344 RepID=A0A916R0D7_9RHOB|nr:hypothetical protein [Amylibacter cionae]GGA23976.1 hypothetical protein GCM10011498_26150 [Amylibacter cionae]
MANYTEADLVKIKAMIAGGLTQAMIAGEMVQYRPLAEMQKIQRLIEADLVAAAKPAFPVRYASTDRGL